MANFNTISIKKNKIGTSDLRKLVSMMERSQFVGGLLKDFEPIEKFVEIAKIYMGMRTVSGKSIINGINVFPMATHIFFCRYSSFFISIDVTKIFLKYQDVYYRILKYEKINEDNLSVAMQCTVRGDVDSEASHA